MIGIMRCMRLFFIIYTGYRESISTLILALQIICQTLRCQCFGVWRLGRIGREYFHQFLGAEMWCQLDLQILLVSTSVLVVGKPAMNGPTDPFS